MYYTITNPHLGTKKPLASDKRFRRFLIPELNGQ